MRFYADLIKFNLLYMHLSFLVKKIGLLISSSSDGWAKYVVKSSSKPIISSNFTSLKKPECRLLEVIISNPLQIMC